MPLLLIIAAVVAFLLYNRKATADVPSGSTLKRSPLIFQPAPVGSSSDAMDNMAEAIARYEGYYSQGSLPNRTNNPGDIGTYGPYVGSYSDAGDGWDALYGYIGKNAKAHPGWDFYDTMRYYLTGDTLGTPGPNQNPDAYAEYVAGYMGVNPTDPVASVLWGS